MDNLLEFLVEADEIKIVAVSAIITLVLNYFKQEQTKEELDIRQEELIQRIAEESLQLRKELAEATEKYVASSLELKVAESRIEVLGQKLELLESQISDLVIKDNKKTARIEELEKLNKKLREDLDEYIKVFDRIKRTFRVRDTKELISKLNELDEANEGVE